MSADQAQLEAGGLIPTNAKLGKADVVDVVVARAYQHGVLPGRIVVRLTSQGVVAGDDLEMATLGFGAAQDRGPVAKERKRALGFPGWALVNDPKNARYALDVVKELKAAGRRAKSKPGTAKEGIDKIAATLAKSVPHFLPSFYEEAGRMFIEAGSQTYAAMYFGKARDAEAVHALEVDEAHRVDGFLEFALAGAVTIKALTQYAKDLADHHAPAAAFAHFRQLAVQRTLGGMPPWGGMAKELQRLAKAAKLDVAAEDRAVLAEIIESPALTKSAIEFWRAYTPAIVALAKGSPKVRGGLLELFPTGSTRGSDIDEVWLELLEQTGASAALVEEVPEEARPSGGRAAWFDKLCLHLSRGRDMLSTQVFTLLRRMAPRLIEEKTPITCQVRGNVVDLDLCELALELGVTVAPKSAGTQYHWQRTRFDLGKWGEAARQPERGRDPVRVAAVPALAALLEESIGDTIGDDLFDAHSAGKQGFLTAKRAWLEQQLTAAETKGLPALVHVIELVTEKVRATTFADLPDLHPRFAALDPARALAKSLSIGALDELGWPALEDAVAELSPDGKIPITQHGGPPAVVLATATKLVAIGKAGRLGTFDLVVPKGQELHTARFIGGQFLVTLKVSWNQMRSYWSSAPADTFDVETSSYSLPTYSETAVELPDGGWLERGSVLHVGDRRIVMGEAFRGFDGTTMWSQRSDTKHRWVERSVTTGEDGRASYPAQIAAYAVDDWRIDPSTTYLMTNPWADTSPLTGQAGLVGTIALVKTTDDTTPTAGATQRAVVLLDGTRFDVPLAPVVTGALALPDGTRCLVASAAHYGEGTQSSLLDLTGTMRGSEVGGVASRYGSSDLELRYQRGQACSTAPSMWHAFTPRDLAGSQRLRTFSVEDARALLVALPDHEVAVADAVTKIATLLPEITHAKLRAGVAGFVSVAAQAVSDRDKLATERAPGNAVARAGSTFDDATLAAGLTGIVQQGRASGQSAFEVVSKVVEWFTREDQTDAHATLPETDVRWLSLALRPSTLAVAALALATPPASRPAVAAFLELLVRLPTAKLRLYSVAGAWAWMPEDSDHPELRWHQRRAYVLVRAAYQAQTSVLEYAPDGVFVAPPVSAPSMHAETRGVPGLDSDGARAVTAAVAAGSTTWSTEAVATLAAATGMGEAEAAYLWAGLPGRQSYGSQFLDKELREQMGLKAKEATLARDSFSGIDEGKLTAVIDAVGRLGVDALLDGRGVTALAAAWTTAFGRRTAVPEELVAQADDELAAHLGKPALMLALFAGGTSSPQLTADAVWGGARDGSTNRVGTDPAFDPSVMVAATQYLPFLYAELPVGDPIRAAAAQAHALILERLNSQTLWIPVARGYLGDEAMRATMLSLLDSVGTPTVETETTNSGWMVPGAQVHRSDSVLNLVVHPATANDERLELITKISAALSRYPAQGNLPALRYVRSPGLAAMMERILRTPVPVGSWEQNPALSSPATVKAAAKHLGVSSEAAALYLQYLVLLKPTPKHLLKWNGWSAKQLAAANDELVAKDLVIEAKRERAQRSLFLPGGWEALKSPNPPLETWKLPLYTVDKVPPTGRFLAMAPFHAMFEVAWERITEGDVPKYEDVKR